MTAVSLRTELATAVQFVNAAYASLAPDKRASVSVVADDALEAALRSEDHRKGLAQIEAWRDRQLAAIKEAAR